MAPRPLPLEMLGLAMGKPKYLGTIDATTTSKTNHEATTPFNNTGVGLTGKVLLIAVADSTGTTRIHPVTTNTGVVTASRTGNHGVPWTDGDIKIVTMGQGEPWVAAICSAGTANVDFWELL